MTTFADNIEASIKKSGSFLVAGCDPVIEKLPVFLHAEAEARATSDGDYIERVLGAFGDLFLSAVIGHVAAIKPNIAFFEQYGVAGISAFARLCRSIRSAKVPLIVDAKRGDIGSTAAAYSAAFLGATRVRGRVVADFSADALTVNPFLGFDTLVPFLRDCQERGKGIFVLCKRQIRGQLLFKGCLQMGGRYVSTSLNGWLNTQTPCWVTQGGRALARWSALPIRQRQSVCVS